MKTKVLTVLTCVLLALSFTGCAARQTECHSPDAPCPATEEIAASPAPAESENGDAPTEPIENTAPPAEVAAPDSPNTYIPPEQPKTETDTLLRCTASSLRVRKGAGTSYAALGSLDKGDMIMPVRKVGDWYEFRYSGSSAYASASYLAETTFVRASDEIERVIDEGKKLLGIPYVYGARRYHFGNGSLNPEFDGKSYDCSSLMQYIFKVGANVNLAMTSREQSLQGVEISRADIRRGDLLFFTNASRVGNTGLSRIGHVALYLGDNVILHTASDHAVIEPISDVRSGYFVTARRLLDG